MDIFKELKKANKKEFNDLLTELTNVYGYSDMDEFISIFYSEYLMSLDDDAQATLTGFIEFCKEALECEKEIIKRTKEINEHHENALLFELEVHPKGLSSNYNRKILIPSFYTVSKMCYAIFSSFGLFLDEAYKVTIDDLLYETILNEDMEDDSLITEEEVLDFCPIDEGTKIVIKFNQYDFICKVVSVTDNTKKFDNAYVFEGKGASLIPYKHKEIVKFCKGNLDKSNPSYEEIKDAVLGLLDLFELNNLLPDQIEEYYSSFEVEPFEE